MEVAEPQVQNARRSRTRRNREATVRTAPEQLEGRHRVTPASVPRSASTRTAERGGAETDVESAVTIGMKIGLQELYKLVKSFSEE
ncbi:hypothetical protein GCM10009777_11580 [Microbacterium pumilum]|uniref:Uncharacterized protein n=1 Tax=Microbacterium pumilum TaxID=344165 RepID=A0ABP5DGQ2_9MICO